jgi:hypothetical protein
LAVAQKVSGVVTTSSPGPIPAASIDRCSAAVQEFTAMACGTPMYAAKARSNSPTRGPVDSHPDCRTATTASISCWPIDGGAKPTADGTTVAVTGSSDR